MQIVVVLRSSEQKEGGWWGERRCMLWFSMCRESGLGLGVWDAVKCYLPLVIVAEGNCLLDSEHWMIWRKCGQNMVRLCCALLYLYLIELSVSDTNHNHSCSVEESFFPSLKYAVLQTVLQRSVLHTSEKVD